MCISDTESFSVILSKTGSLDSWKEITKKYEKKAEDGKIILQNYNIHN